MKVKLTLLLKVPIVNQFLNPQSGSGGGGEGRELGDALVGLADEVLEAGGAGVELGGDVTGHPGELGEQLGDLVLDFMIDGGVLRG